MLPGFKRPIFVVPFIAPVSMIAEVIDSSAGKDGTGLPAALRELFIPRTRRSRLEAFQRRRKLPKDRHYPERLAMFDLNGLEGSTVVF